jgi:oligopeptide/dipeptide ABC transporter ATP-binding protein
MEPLLRLAEIRKYYRKNRRQVRAVDGVDLEVQAGEAVGLVGESGCGKSTLARCAVRLIEPTSGTVHFDGVPLHSLSAAELRKKRRDFQIIFQDAYVSLDPRMDIRSILGQPFEAHDVGTRAERNRRIGELLEAVALDGSVLDRYPGQLSGGQQQRVVIARALALKPRLLIADEPVSALDASVQAQILNLLADIRKRYGLTLLLISHSLPVVNYLCERVAVMYLGRIVEESAAGPFFGSPRHPYSELLLQSMPNLNSKFPTRIAAGDIPSVTYPPAGCTFHLRCPRALTTCARESPTLVALKSGEKVACFLYT